MRSPDHSGLWFCLWFCLWLCMPDCIHGWGCVLVTDLYVPSLLLLEILWLQWSQTCFLEVFLFCISQAPGTVNTQGILTLCPFGHLFLPKHLWLYYVGQPIPKFWENYYNHELQSSAILQPVQKSYCTVLCWITYVRI